MCRTGKSCQNAKFYVDFTLIYVILCSFKQTNPTDRLTLCAQDPAIHIL